MRSSEEPYYCSGRAITINPEITQRGLRMAVIETLNKVGINPKDFDTATWGSSSQKVPSIMDVSLRDNRIHIEIFIKKLPPERFII